MRNLFLLALCIFFSCSPVKKENNIGKLPDANLLGNYVTEYTKNVISVNDDLIFRMSGAVVNPDQVGEPVNEEFYSISPRVPGKAFWKDMSTIMFSPDEHLEYNTNYAFTIKLGSLFDDIPLAIQKVNFPFKTEALSFEMYLYNIDYDEINNERLSISGRIVSNDYVKDNIVSSLLSASQKNNSEIEVLWTHSSDGRRHSFQVVNIQRQETSSELNISWNDKAFNSGFNGKRDIAIAPKGAFQVVAVNASKGNSRKITITLTEPVDRNQTLDGLIKIKDYKGDFRYDINGAEIQVYPEDKIISPFAITINSAIKNTNGKKLADGFKTELSFDPIKPAIRLAGKGVIVPHNEEIIFPFEAINLKGAKVEIFKIFSDNVLQFLQYNRLNATYNLEPVGRIVHQEEIKLSDINADANDANYVRYALDLSKMIAPDPGAVYQIRIGFSKKDVATYECEEEVPSATYVSRRDGFTSIMEYPPRYNWSDRDNPCKSSYYNSSRFITRNVLGSNVGIIAKRNAENKLTLLLSDLRTIQPLQGAEVRYYDFQQQEIMSGLSGSDGVLSVQLDRKPAFGIVKHNEDFGYINLQNQYSNSLSEFEVSGRSKREGLDGYIYGERGVWRPGDTLFLNFVLEDKTRKLPASHPVTMIVKDSKGKEKYNQSTSIHAGHIYHFPVVTNESDPTGNWSAIVKVGGTNFQKNLKVETIKPNRLKIRYDLDENQSLALHSKQSLELRSEWLHGAPANGLKAKVDLQIQSKPTKFKRYDSYVFDDPARKISPRPITVFDKNLSQEGTGNIKIEENKNWLAPGKLRANFKTKVFEKGGNFSEDNFSINADLYQSYVGIRIPKTRWGSKFIPRGENKDIPIVVVDTEGQPISNRKLTIGLYKAQWNWWYDRGYSRKYNFNSSNHSGSISKTEAVTNTKGEAAYSVKFEEYGNYMIRVCDEETGHCTGDMFYTGYSWSRNRDQNGPQQLIFTTDKKTYYTGENISMKIPSNDGSKLLVSVENGEDVLKTFWVEGEKNETIITLPAESYMNSNVYLHVHLIQPHNNGNNDLPMRMYGVVPISVIDKNTQIEPELTIPKVIKPNQAFTVKVSEKLGKKMHYTLAVVDEGLLDLTRFKTPDLWNHFYAKQALGIKTWDIYDLVLDGYGGELDRLISIGGDAGETTNKKGKKANRFVPVVTHLGPFTLKEGDEHSHSIQMPNYIGSVRTMVVARNEESYGKAEETTQVKKPLMVLATLPRVLGPNESLKLPANVFAMEDKIKNVKVSVESSENINITAAKSKNLEFDRVGDQQVYFDMNVGNEMGSANVKIRAEGHGEGAFDEVNIAIRNPNPFTSKVYEAAIQPGENWEMEYELFGTLGSNEGVLEMSSLPPMNFDQRLKYLIRYPYGCIEQTTSSVFPQLYLNVVTDLDDKTKYKVEQNINKAITRLSLFQTSLGGFAYWPGDNNSSEWGTNYGLHFLLEAKDKGYYVPQNLFTKLLKYQDLRAENINLPSNVNESKKSLSTTQAYRLYTLAKAGRANIGAMNVLRNYRHLSITGAHMLGASYALIGKKEIAKELVANKGITINPYVETGNTYGSHVRDMAMLAEAHQILGNTNEHAQLIKQIAKEMSSQRWYSTQTTAYALLSLGKFLTDYEGGDLSYSCSINGEPSEKGQSSKAVIQRKVDVESSNRKIISLKNNSKGVLFARFVLSGQLPPGVDEAPSSKHIKMDISYTDMNGTPIDHTRLVQGSDFIAKVSIQNLRTRANSIQEVALSQIFPSGWEIQNERLSSVSNVTGNSFYEYRDIRDDRVYTFFDINGTSPLNFSVMLNATYAGKFYLPPVFAEAMYDNEIQAKSRGEWIEVIASSESSKNLSNKDDDSD